MISSSLIIGQFYQSILRFVEQYKNYMFQMIALSGKFSFHLFINRTIILILISYLNLEITIMPIMLFTAIGDFSNIFLLFPYYRFLGKSLFNRNKI